MKFDGEGSHKGFQKLCFLYFLEKFLSPLSIILGSCLSQRLNFEKFSVLDELEAYPFGSYISDAVVEFQTLQKKLLSISVFVAIRGIIRSVLFISFPWF